MGADNLLAQPSPAYHREIPYDPSKCSSDAQNMVYFAVSRRVFRQPRPNLTYIPGYPIGQISSLPQPPKPEDPEGCPGHPIQGVAVGTARVYPMPGEPICCFAIRRRDLARC